MALLTTAEPRALIPIPGCAPGLPSTDWTSCSYTVDLVQGVLCIPPEMCAYLLRASVAAGAGGGAGGTRQRHGAARAWFSCSHTPQHGAQLEDCGLTRCVLATCPLTVQIDSSM